MKNLLLDIEHKFLIDRDVREILAMGADDINKTLKDFDDQGIPYTMQIWFQSICPIWADFFVQNYHLTSGGGYVIMAGP